MGLLYFLTSLERRIVLRYKVKQKTYVNQISKMVAQDKRLPEVIDAEYASRTGNYQVRMEDGFIFLVPREIFECAYTPVSMDWRQP